MNFVIFYLTNLPFEILVAVVVLEVVVVDVVAFIKIKDLVTLKIKYLPIIEQFASFIKVKNIIQKPINLLNTLQLN